MTRLDPRFDINWDRRSSDVRVNECSIGPGLNIRWQGIASFLDLRHFDGSTILTIGHPILGDKIDIANSVALLMNGGSPSEINGQFLFVVFDKQKETLRIINDRFTSYPVYFAEVGATFVMSTSYGELARQLKEKGCLRINPGHCFEYILLQRLIGTKTLDQLSEFLAPAMQLVVSSGQLTKSCYWTPSFTKQKQSSSKAVRN